MKAKKFTKSFWRNRNFLQNFDEKFQKAKRLRTEVNILRAKENTLRAKVKITGTEKLKSLCGKQPKRTEVNILRAEENSEG